ncbi:hypothetical protein ON010_g14387 [Phytophthora cinnamomi]|nr:hypothetical protein ON010_g14387 [Phytophthora cinnamomi]
MSEDAKSAMVDRVIAELNLGHISGSRIGAVGGSSTERGVSGDSHPGRAHVRPRQLVGALGCAAGEGAGEPRPHRDPEHPPAERSVVPASRQDHAARKG